MEAKETLPTRTFHATVLDYLLFKEKYKNESVMSVKGDGKMWKFTMAQRI